MATNNANSYNQEEEEEQQQDETLQNFDKMSNNLSWNIKEKSKVNEKLDEIEEQNRSEKISQLSTSTTTEKDPIMIVKEINDQLEIIPNYLTKQYIAFKKLMHQALSSVTTTTTEKLNSNTNELRKIAILIYKIMVIQTYQYLWKTYFKSGTGQLIAPFETKQKLFYSTTLPIWPKEIKTIEMFLTYIEENLNSSLSKKIKHQVELIHYDYHIRALKLEYFQHKPNEYQGQLMKQICQSKYEQETSEQEYEFLKQQIAYYSLPSQSLACSNIFHSPLFNSIQNIPLREELIQKCKDAAEQGRNNLFNIYLKSAEDQRQEYKKKHEANIKKMDASQHTLNNNEKLSSTLVQLINERCNKISQRIQCIYKYKRESFQSKSN
ncbi:unnamed protein product [Rotaria magnacalcarata]|uniref:Uncharacterized protein n=2 Tax=Rotaria magnacalcarata TaxID=392030 RepID=A0A816MS21_9BILA|nr:unnamed protein product [Rotaria magnacalcarata]